MASTYLSSEETTNALHSFWKLLNGDLYEKAISWTASGLTFDVKCPERFASVWCYLMRTDAPIEHFYHFLQRCGFGRYNLNENEYHHPQFQKNNLEKFKLFKYQRILTVPSFKSLRPREVFNYSVVPFKDFMPHKDMSESTLNIVQAAEIRELLRFAEASGVFNQPRPTLQNQDREVVPQASREPSAFYLLSQPRTPIQIQFPQANVPLSVQGPGEPLKDFLIMLPEELSSGIAIPIVDPRDSSKMLLLHLQFPVLPADFSRVKIIPIQDAEDPSKVKYTLIQELAEPGRFQIIESSGSSFYRLDYAERFPQPSISTINQNKEFPLTSAPDSDKSRCTSRFSPFEDEEFLQSFVPPEEVSQPRTFIPIQGSGEVSQPNMSVPIQGPGEVSQPYMPVPIQGSGEVSQPYMPVPIQGSGEVSQPNMPVPIQGSGEVSQPNMSVPIQGSGEVSQSNMPVPIQDEKSLQTRASCTLDNVSYARRRNLIGEENLSNPSRPEFPQLKTHIPIQTPDKSTQLGVSPVKQLIQSKTPSLKQVAVEPTQLRRSKRIAEFNTDVVITREFQRANQPPSTAIAKQVKKSPRLKQSKQITQLNADVVTQVQGENSPTTAIVTQVRKSPRLKQSKQIAQLNAGVVITRQIQGRNPPPTTAITKQVKKSPRLKQSKQIAQSSADVETPKRKLREHEIEEIRQQKDILTLKIQVLRCKVKNLEEIVAELRQKLNKKETHALFNPWK